MLPVRVRSYGLLALAVCMIVLALAVHAALPGKQVHAANEVVGVWLTTADGSAQLTQQPSITFTSDTPYNPLTIYVDDSRTYQQIDGFGASLTDSSAWLLSGLSPVTRTAVMHSLFDPLTGIGMSFLRQPIGASDFTKDGSTYSYDDVPLGQSDPLLAGFSITHDVTYIIPLLQQALQINPFLKIMATPWSPPGWMKTSGSMGGGSLIPADNELFAAYLVKYLQAYQAQGIPIYAITPQNEPALSFDYPSSVLAPGDEATLVAQYLGPALAHAHLATKVLGYDFINGANDAPAGYPFQVMSDPSASPYLAGTAYHCYGGGLDVMGQMHDTYPKKDIYVTECSGLVGRNNAMEAIINSVRSWARSVVLWNVALDPHNGPHGAGCADCTGLITIDPATGVVSYGKEYYELGQVSKFVAPGAFRVGSNTFGNGIPSPGSSMSYTAGSGTSNVGTIEDVAFKNPDGSRVVVVYNSALTSQTLKVQWGAEAFNYTLQAGATATFKWSGIQTAGSVAHPPGPEYYAVDTGGTGSGTFMPDSYFDDGRSISTSVSIDTTGVNQPAPQEVYQTARFSPTGFSYTLPALRPGATYGVRLHFAEITQTARGQRQFNVLINGAHVLDGFDIFAAAGGVNRAIVEQYVTTADSSGKITIQFEPGPTGGPLCNGIEIVDPAYLPPTLTPTPTSSPTSTATPLPSSAGSTDHRLKPTRTRRLVLRIVVSGRMVILTIQTTPHARTSATLRVLAQRVVHRPGKHRKRRAQRVAFYSLRIQGTADGKGQFTRRLTITYKPRKAVLALLTVSVRVGHAVVTRTTGVTLMPQPDQRNKQRGRRGQRNVRCRYACPGPRACRSGGDRYGSWCVWG